MISNLNEHGETPWQHYMRLHKNAKGFAAKRLAFDMFFFPGSNQELVLRMTLLMLATWLSTVCIVDIAKAIIMFF